MTIRQLDLQHVRIISSARLLPNPRYNVLHGANGTGKTSWLEAIHLLSSGASFRTHETSSLVSHGQTDLSVFARLDSHDEIGVHVSRKGTRARINQRACTLRSELATALPCQAFYHDVFDIMTAGPAVRRKVLDWGLFHVKPSYHVLWQQARRVLKQRNAVLKQKNNLMSALAPWNKQWVELCEALHVERQAYCHDWFAHFQQILPQLVNFGCTLTYEKGWDKQQTGKSLMTCLTEQFARDCLYQTTHSGIHQADIAIQVLSEIKAKQVLSRGQQKMVLLALKLAQTQLLGRPCLYLLDDMTSELDKEHVGRFLSFIKTLPGQFFFASLTDHEFKSVWAADEALFLNVNMVQSGI
jgi:DNA replication and repair protein RecF